MASLEYEKLTGMSSVTVTPVDPSSTEVMIFDIYGRRCSTKPGGLYIEVSNGVATKKINRD